MRGSAVKRTIILSYVLLELSLLIFLHKRLFSLSCLGVHVVFGLQVLPFIDNSHLGSILWFQWCSCILILLLPDQQCQREWYNQSGATEFHITIRESFHLLKKLKILYHQSDIHFIHQQYSHLQTLDLHKFIYNYDSMYN